MRVSRMRNGRLCSGAAWIQSLEPRCLLSASGFSVDAALGQIWTGFVRRRFAGHGSQRLVASVSLDPALTNGKETGQVSVSGEPTLTFAAVPRGYAFAGLLTNTTGPIHGQFSKIGFRLTGSFSEPLEGHIVVGRFNLVDGTFAPLPAGATRGASAAKGYAPGNTLAANAPLANPFSNTAISGTGAGAVNGAGGMLSNTGNFAVPTGATPTGPAFVAPAASAGASDIVGPMPAAGSTTSTAATLTGTSATTGGGTYPASSATITPVSSNNTSVSDLVSSGSYNANTDVGFSGMTISG